MAHSYIEIANDSRKLSVTNAGISQTLVIDLLIDVDPSTPDFYEDLPIEDDDTDYTFFEASDDVVATKYAYSIFPEFRYFPSYDLDKRVLVLNRIGLEQLGTRHWRATGEYTFDINRGSGGQRPEEGKNTLPYVKVNFNIGGGTKTITKSQFVDSVAIATDAQVDSALNVANLALGGAIGITEDSLEGTDVPTADLRVQVTVYYLPDFVTFEFVKKIRDAIAGEFNTGSYNSDTFLTCEEGEVQLRGASGGGIVVDIIPITYDFYIGKNVTDQEDEGFPNLTAKAHDIVDYIFFNQWDDEVKKMLIKPTIRAVHRVASPMNYATLEVPEVE